MRNLKTDGRANQALSEIPRISPEKPAARHGLACHLIDVEPEGAGDGWFQITVAVGGRQYTLPVPVATLMRLRRLQTQILFRHGVHFEPFGRDAFSVDGDAQSMWDFGVVRRLHDKMIELSDDAHKLREVLSEQ